MSRPLHRLGDLAHLPTSAFGTASLTWWGVLGFMTIEGAGFALALASYFFLMAQETLWPPGAPAPDLLWGTVTTIGLLLSEIPNIWLKRAAEAERLGAVRIGLLVLSLAGLLLLVSRAIEFDHLNIDWDRNAYASIVWALLLLHSVHMLTDWVESLVLTALMFTDHGKEERRFVDTSEDCLYWHFVVLSWLPIYVVLYWLPRL